jgi:hypothetical protein
MVRLGRRSTRPGFKSLYYVAAYWILNIALVLIEARWHVIYRLTLWDISEFEKLGPLFAKLAHLGVVAAIATLG